MLVAFEVTKHVIAETEGGVTPRDVSFRNHVPYALVYTLNKFARVSLYILFFFGVHFLFFLTYTWVVLRGFPKDTPFPVLGRFPDSTQLWVPSQLPSFAGSFLLLDLLLFGFLNPG